MSNAVIFDEDGEPIWPDIKLLDTSAAASELYAALVTEAKAEMQPPPGAFSAQSFAAATGTTLNPAKRFLNEHERAGSLESREYLTGGHWTRFWWFVGGKK